MITTSALAGQIGWIQHTIATGFDGAGWACAADFDNDNDLDIVGAAWEADAIAWWQNDGAGTFTEYVLTNTFDGAARVHAADLDGDLDCDILAAAYFDGEITWWENTGSGFTEHTITDSLAGAYSVYTVDIDDDGDMDVLAAGRTANTIAWFENDGDENFTRHDITTVFGDASDVYAADVDSDGEMDVLGAAGTGNDIAWWENDGNENFILHLIDGSFAGATAVCGIDLDEDNDTDVLGAAWNAGQVAWWENNGSQYSYSNAGYMVLGLIIERVTGEDYFDYVIKHIYERAGMVNTDTYETDHVVPNCAVGYTTFGAEPGMVKNNLFMHVVKGGPAGGGYSTVEDLLNFSNALLDHTLLTAEYTEIITTGKIDVGMNDRYAYGFRERFENGHRIVGHGGGFPGISSNLSMYIDLGYTVSVLSNSDRGSQPVTLFIEELLVGKTQYTKNIELTNAVLEHITEHGYDEGVEFYKENQNGGTVNENTINNRGYELLGTGDTEGAIAVFRFNVFLYPESSNVYDSLGEAYMKTGETQLAIENYERSLKLDAQNTNAVEMLEKLKQK